MVVRSSSLKPPFSYNKFFETALRPASKQQCVKAYQSMNSRFVALSNRAAGGSLDSPHAKGNLTQVFAMKAIEIINGSHVSAFPAGRSQIRWPLPTGNRTRKILPHRGYVYHYTIGQKTYSGSEKAPQCVRRRRCRSCARSVSFSGRVPLAFFHAV